MELLVKQEQFELEVLDKLNSAKLLNGLAFVGGTMLRLCYGLQRFSVDLDFWIIKSLDSKKLLSKISRCLSEAYVIKDSALKFHTILFEIRSNNYPRNLKIEIRREKKTVKVQQAIAFSKHSSIQVLVDVLSLEDMMKAKIEAFIARKEIRDLFDLEFLIMRGVKFNGTRSQADQLLSGLDSLTTYDYKVKLGSLLEEEKRQYYIKENFKILRANISERLQKRNLN